MPPALPLLRPLAFAAAAGTAIALVAGSGPDRARRDEAAAPAGPWIWVSNEGSGDVAVIDGGTGEVVTRVPVGPRPRGLRYDGAAQRIYVAVSAAPLPGRGPTTAMARPAAGAAGGGDGIAVVDSASRRVLQTLPSDVPAGEQPEGATPSPDGRLVAVTSEGANRVDFIDVAAARTVARVPTCRRPRAVVFTPDGALAFASCEAGAAVAVIDAQELRPAGEIKLPPGSRPMGLALAPDGRTLYVSNGRAGTVSVVDVARRAVTATSTAVGARVWGLAVTPDARSLYVVDRPGGAVVVLDGATLQPVRRIPTGALPWGVAVVP